MSNNNEPFTLSKSSFIKGAVCHKWLWLYKHRQKLLPPLTAAQQHTFDQGTKVGKLAQQLFPGGIDASPETHLDYAPAVELTRRLIERGELVIYEAAFIADGVMCALDILVKREDGWYAFEVKSTSGKVHDIQLYDAALQYQVMKKAGLEVRDISIVHINSDYVRDGEIEPAKLFTTESVYYLVIALQDEIEQKILELKKVVARKRVPPVKIGPQCTSPFQCPLKSYCWSDVPEASILDFALYRKQERFELYHAGTRRIADIKDWKDLKFPYNNVAECHVNNGVYLEPEPLKKFMGQVKYPLYFLDFETANWAVPQYQNTSPYEQIPFQYSIHVIKKKGAEPVHRSYLAKPGVDFREDLLVSLLRDLGSKGTVFAYSVGFERSRLNGLALMFPEYEPQINAVIGRLMDLALPFSKRWWYDPRFGGRYSIKKVLPAIAPHLSYDNLPVNNGEDASVNFMRMVEQPGADWTKLREDLLSYCRMDTWAMVELYRFLDTLV